MTKKGRFKLLSYLIEDCLIYYKSLNKSEKLFAFSIFKVSNLNQIILILNEFLKKGFFYYYSIQINIPNRDIEVILCFRANEKNQIIELFGLTSHKLIEYDHSIKFLKKRNLEGNFINIFLRNFDSNIRIYKKPESILIKNHAHEKVLEFYDIIIKGYENQNQILIHLINFIKNLNQKGYLILNFKIFDNQPALNIYFVRIIESHSINHINFVEDVNNFFNFNLLNKSDINLAKIYRILWRLNLTEKFSPFNKVDTTLIIRNKKNTITEFNLKFEELLQSSQIEFQRLNQNLIFIEQKIVFMTLIKLNFKLILKIFKRFFSKYLIYILILDENEYQKLLKVDKVRLLKDVVILNYEEFKNLNLKKLKNP
ncbi:MAG: hypothetical protein ACFE8M_00595 [Candidatus Hermodarchaeota archaeon]